MRKRHPENAPGDWYVDTRCIDCGAARTAAPGLIVERGGQSVFARQPQTADERMMAWRARLLPDRFGAERKPCSGAGWRISGADDQRNLPPRLQRQIRLRRPFVCHPFKQSRVSRVHFAAPEDTDFHPVPQTSIQGVVE